MNWVIPTGVFLVTYWASGWALKKIDAWWKQHRERRQAELGVEALEEWLSRQ